MLFQRAQINYDFLDLFGRKFPCKGCHLAFLPEAIKVVIVFNEFLFGFHNVSV